MKRTVFALALLILACRTAAQGSADVDRTIDAMTDDERVAQLLFFGFSGQVADGELQQLAADWHVGGIALYAHNIESREQVRRLNESIVRLSTNHIVPFIAVDQEGGIVHRLRLGVPIVPSNMALGAARSTDLSRRAGRAVGGALRDLGFTMNFAPVLDVLSDSHNAAIGTRAFSDDAALTARLGAAFADGLQSVGVVAVGKHFPGQGGVAGDSHMMLPRLTIGETLLRTRELVPFRAAFRGGLVAVMSAHIALPGIVEGPATLSHRVMTKLLRDEMHFEGIAISDALQMEALAGRREAGALALDAILAGCDMVLTLGDARQRRGILEFLSAAYHDGRLPRARVREALRRILLAKASLRRTNRALAEDGEALVREIATRAATIAAGSAPLIPLSVTTRRHVVFVGPEGPLRQMLDPEAAVPLPTQLDAEKRAALSAAARPALSKASLCVAAAANEAQFALLRELREANPKLPFVFINLGSPFRMMTGRESATLFMYAEDDASQRTAVAILRGDLKPTGMAPVRLPSADLHPPEREASFSVYQP